MDNQEISQSDSGRVAEPQRVEPRAMALTNSDPGADMELVAIRFGHLPASKASPMPHECRDMWRREFVTSPLSTVTLVAKLGSETATCTLPTESAGVLSKKFRIEIQDPQNTDSVVTIHDHKFIVVDLMVQHILYGEYYLDKAQQLGEYRLTYMKKAGPGIEDDNLTVQIDETPTELHLQMYHCAKKMEIPGLLFEATRNFKTSLLKDPPTADQFVNMMEKYKLFDPSENTSKDLLHAIATCGAMQRSVWLQEGGTKYFEFLGTSGYAKYEGAAERDLDKYKLENNIPERMVSIGATDQQLSSKKRLSTDPSLDARTPKMRTVGTGQGQRENIGGRVLQRPGSSNTYQPTVEDHPNSPTPRRRDHGSSAKRTNNKALPPTPTPSELDRSWQSMDRSKASQGEKAASTPMKPASGLLRTPRPGSSLRQSQAFHGEADGSDDIDGPSLYDDFNPPYASHSPQGPSPVAPRTVRKQGGDQPTTDQTKVDRQDTTEYALPKNNISADENADESTFIPLISSSDHGMDDNTEVPRIEYSFDEGKTLTQVPHVPVLAPAVPTRSTSDETGGQKKKEDTSMTDVSGDGDDGVKVDDGVKAEDRMEE
ncbi:hypothetical protein J4E93_008314 [Alternaria ventricosa]|uniref:uncharacterized protein n=1 Tax=Alternaria ventricosa TaxID=1187951 RepID=UPI0020C355DC|nr:uncharacterized protein J4E93_008314 [Alternaria ventricosa]KAI4640723.1 hypothetical protein J4E93_008314 [Alternaria ventricosa]